METNNIYKRSFKTKKEEYEEKLKQRNDNDQWIFGNTFGRPGGGAPLRDKNGNVISNLRTISNGNIFKYNAEEFTKGENNINNIYNINNNRLLYPKQNNNNINNINITNAINDPFTPFRNYINQFDPNNINNNYSYQNQNILTEEQKKDIYLNQFRQNPYLIQMPDGNYGILTPYPLIQPLNNLNNLNYPSNINNNNINNITENITQQRPYSSNNINIVNNNNINTNNSNTDLNNINNKTSNNFNNIPRKFKKKYQNLLYLMKLLKKE